jgi:drug/metabolite transporter (DMT)-like permease
MRLWLAFVIGAGLCWGTYVPLIAYGGKSLSDGSPGVSNRFAAILCVGGAYFVLGVLFPLGWFLVNGGWGNARFSMPGVLFSSLAGAAGALGAICVVFATSFADLKDRVYIAPLIFALAPVINVLVSLVWHPTAESAFHLSWPQEWPGWKLVVGVVLACCGAGLVLYAKEEQEARRLKTNSPPPARTAPHDSSS